MKFNNEDNTKELGFGEANTATPVSTSENTTPTPQPEGNTNGESNKATFMESTPAPKAAEASKPTPTVKPEGSNGGGNSFYDRQQNNSASTKWFKDWRGKTLGLSLAALILIGAGIPAGMAMAGYWRETEFGNIVDNTEVDTAIDLTSDEIERIYDQALLDHYESLVYEGYITQSAHDRKIDDAEETANDTIDNEKETLKANYGNTWEEEWDNELKKKGFHTVANGGEQEYKDSMISASIEESVKSKYTTKGALTSTVTVKDGDDETFDFGKYDYVSTGKNSRDKYYFVENMFPAFYVKAEDGTTTTWDNIVDSEGNAVSYSYTPEDLMNLYVYTYEPIVFNNSLLPFTPVKGANDTTADIQGDNVYMTNDDVKAAWSFANAETKGTAPAAKNYGGIQTRYAIDFSSRSLGTESKIAVYEAMAGNATVESDATITSIVNAGFANVESFEGKTSSSITSNDIANMNSTDVQEFGKGISNKLIELNLLTQADVYTLTAGGDTPDDTTDDVYELTTEAAPRNFATIGLFNPEDFGSSETVSFVSTNGLNNIGISYENEDVVIEQLNNYADVKDSYDLGLVTSFNTWFGNSFKYITIIDYLTNPSKNEDGWFNKTETTDPISGEITTTMSMNLVFDKTNTDLVWEDISATIDEADIDDADKEAAKQKIAKMIPFVLFEDVVLSTTNNITETYNSAKTFVDTNWEDYNANDFETGLGKDLTVYLFDPTTETPSHKAIFANNYFTSLVKLIENTPEKNFKNEVINKGGDE